MAIESFECFFGNQWFAITVYLSPLLFQNLMWLTLASVIFVFLEFLMHAIVFAIGLKRWYNPGLFTAVIGLTLPSLWYLLQEVPKGTFTWLDFIFALL